MAEQKTKKTQVSVDDFIEAIANETMRKDCQRLTTLMNKITKAEPKVWSSGIVGFGDYHYVYASGREGDWFVMGFAPRKSAISIYCTFAAGLYKELLEKLGPHTTGVGCLYIKSLEHIDIKVLEKFLRTASAEMKKKLGA